MGTIRRKHARSLLAEQLERRELRSSLGSQVTVTLCQGRWRNEPIPQVVDAGVDRDSAQSLTRWPGFSVTYLRNPASVDLNRY